MLLPLLIFLVIVGWYIDSAGDQKRSTKAKRKPAEQENVIFLPAIPDEKQEARVE